MACDGTAKPDISSNLVTEYGTRKATYAVIENQNGLIHLNEKCTDQLGTLRQKTVSEVQ